MEEQNESLIWLELMASKGIKTLGQKLQERCGKKLIITETGDYGKSGQYGYYTLVAKVGTVKDGDYVIVVMRNDHAREEFKLKYDSSRAN